jgi:hypothetical protein
MSGALDASHVPDLILEQYRLNELPLEQAARIERLLRDDAALRDRLSALERSDEEIARRYPPVWIAERVRERLAAPPAAAPQRPRRVRRLVLVAALAAGALAVAVVLPWRAAVPAPESDRIWG